MVTPAARGSAVAQLRDAHGVSQRRACSRIGAERTRSAIGIGRR